ncbi:hypothetical protein SORBI_3002G098100 [Sorghum bicolor]|uniref:Uncharacterized protein n=1 Tax=Sorghum bicolor TaxID=4558 RepID=A0A1B6QA79_SORBI|nr:hypothetical protein SORBI_3002G098100 [Sorghum bicolor]
MAIQGLQHHCRHHLQDHCQQQLLKVYVKQSTLFYIDRNHNCISLICMYRSVYLWYNTLHEAIASVVVLLILYHQI